MAKQIARWELPALTIALGYYAFARFTSALAAGFTFDILSLVVALVVGAQVLAAATTLIRVWKGADSAVTTYRVLLVLHFGYALVFMLFNPPPLTSGVVLVLTLAVGLAYLGDVLVRRVLLHAHQSGSAAGATGAG